MWESNPLKENLTQTSERKKNELGNKIVGYPTLLLNNYILNSIDSFEIRLIF
jgi:hypothetical protein